jgi:hypothetical protein
MSDGGCDLALNRHAIVTAILNDEDFGSRLEWAIARSAPKSVEAKPIKAYALEGGKSIKLRAITSWSVCLPGSNSIRASVWPAPK